MPDNATSIAPIEAFVKTDKPVCAVRHSPAAFVYLRGKDGDYLVKIEPGAPPWIRRSGCLGRPTSIGVKEIE